MSARSEIPSDARRQRCLTLTHLHNRKRFPEAGLQSHRGALDAVIHAEAALRLGLGEHHHGF